MSPYTAAVPNDSFVSHCLELLAPLGRVRSRRMFGGHGLYVDDLFVALIASDTLYLKADADSAARFEAAGGQPFTYVFKQGKVGRLGFWTVPPDAMESPVLMLPWARLAVQAALKAANAKPAASKAALRKRTPKAPRGR